MTGKGSCRQLAAAGACALLAARAIGSTYVVDANGGAGANFTDVPPAIAAAQSGDVLLVMPGNYSAFTLDKGLKIIGYPTAYVAGTATISGVPAQGLAAIVRLKPLDLVVVNCLGPVVVEEIQGLQTIRVQNSIDVRFREVTAEATGFNSPTDTAIVTGSRIEVVQSTLDGWDGFSHGSCDCTLSGGFGLLCQSSSRAHLSIASGRGGHGNWTNIAQAGNGGYAVLIDSSSSAIIVGPGAFVGGNGGQANSSCLANGFARAAAGNSGAAGQLRVSGASFTGGTAYIHSACLLDQQPGILGPYQTASPDDPTLSITGNPAPGQQVTVTLSGAPGAQARFWLGRHLILQVDPAIVVELLVDQQRIVNLGAIPASGQVPLTLTIPGVYVPGIFFGLQGEYTLASGEVRRTNSIPIVVR